MQAQEGGKLAAGWSLCQDTCLREIVLGMQSKVRSEELGLPFAAQ